MSLIPYAGQEPREIGRQIPPRRPTSRHEKKWFHIIEPLNRSQAALDEFNREGERIFTRRGMPVIYRRIVNEVAAQHRVNVMLIASNSRIRIAVRARNDAIYRIKANNTSLSSTKLGRWFDRDWTSILHSIASHQERAGLPHLTGYDLDRRRVVAAAAPQPTR